MLRIHQYLKPTPVGIIHIGQLSAVSELCKNAGVHLYDNKADWRWTRENVSEYIKGGLIYGSRS